MTPHMEAMCAARAATLYETAPLREAFLNSGLTLGEVARRLGCVRHRKGRIQPDTTRAARLLGLSPYTPGSGRPARFRERISYENAERLAVAIGVDPYEVGL